MNETVASSNSNLKLWISGGVFTLVLTTVVGFIIFSSICPCTLTPGGLLFGAVDEVANTIWIDQAFGPPPDSDQSPSGFVCGTEGVHQIAAKVTDYSGGRTSFVGMWHSHPVSAGSPSETDIAAMIETLALAETAPRYSVMAIVGHAASAPDLRCHVFSRAEMRKLVGIA